MQCASSPPGASQVDFQAKKMRNRFLAQFYVGHSGTKQFYATISRRLKSTISPCEKSSKRAYDCWHVACITVQIPLRILCITHKSKVWRHSTSNNSNFSTNGCRIFCRTTMSDVKLRQESIPHVFILWKSMWRAPGRRKAISLFGFDLLTIQKLSWEIYWGNKKHAESIPDAILRRT